MTTITVKRYFPHSEASTIHQDGSRLSTPSKGVEVVLHTRIDELDPCSAEVITGQHYAEIGLWFHGKELSDYDGVFFLPREVGQTLADAGYVVTKDCFA